MMLQMDGLYFFRRACCLILLVLGTSVAFSNPLTLWYDKDAGDSFTDALPIGNGYMGGLIYGGVEKDYIGLNESTVWSGGPGDNNKSGAANYLNDVRSALFSGNYGAAESLVNDHMIGPGPASFQPVGNLVISTSHASATDYYRELDLSTAIAKTRYVHDGVEYTREYFASYPDHVIVVRLSSNRSGKVSFNATLTTPHRSNNMKDAENMLIQNVTVNAIQFQNRLMISTDGGSFSVRNGTISVTDANSATLILTTATNFKAFDDVSGDPNALAEGIMNQVSGKSYEQILADHLADYQALFNRVRLNVGEADASSSNVTTWRVRNFNTTDDPDFVELYYQFGRYLLIASSRSGGQPANLQGIWNKDTNPIWGSKYTTNINLEMNYWMAESANLPECAVPLIDKVKSMVPQGEKTAKVHWGVSEGWVEHHNTDLWNRSAPIDGAWGLWPSGAGWLSTHLWEHYLFNPSDKAFLADVYPTIKGAALFFMNSMVEEPVSGHGYLVTAPSASPENTHGPYNDCFAPTMDVQIIRDVLNYTAEASEILGVDEEMRGAMRQAVKRLPPHQIGQHGQLQEWFEDWDDPRSDHRHVSHLYGMFPSAQITTDATPELAEAAKTTLKQRGDLATGWSLAWKINLWARLHDGNHAYDLIRMLLTTDRTYNNLFDAHPPFQIDGNFGAVSGINEMLLQSHNGRLQILPALPNKWSNGYVNGLRARGGFLVDSLAWQDGKMTALSIVSLCGGTLNVVCGVNEVSVPTEAGKTYLFDGNLKLMNQPVEPVMIPARIEAEDYASMSGVQIEPDKDGVPNLGWINDGDWSKYWILVPKTGQYKFLASVASEADEPSTIVVNDSVGNELGVLTVDVDRTDGWNDWYVAESALNLKQGVQELTFTYKGESTFLMNVDWFELDGDTTGTVSGIGKLPADAWVKILSATKGRITLSIAATDKGTNRVELYDLNGKLLERHAVSDSPCLVRLGEKKRLAKGTYVVVAGNEAERLSFRVMMKD